MVQRVVDSYKNSKKKKPKHLLEYADRMRFGKIAREYISE